MPVSAAKFSSKMLNLKECCVFIGIILLLICFTESQDILGCGGFVKSEVEINFSMVEACLNGTGLCTGHSTVVDGITPHKSPLFKRGRNVETEVILLHFQVKLYTKQGSLKYQTDCAPNNGYYMIPVYDKGEYVLKVEPPSGWTFEPTSVELNIDGTSDQCSRGEDINFQFTGFGLVGTVVSFGQSVGPAGVKLTLMKQGSKDVVKASETKTGGDFMFERVLPGDYVVKASHPTWEFDIDKVDVHVGRETGNAGNTLTVLGFDVRGRVFSESEGVKGVSFVLFSDERKKHEVIHCDKSDLPGFQLRDGLKEIICFVPSDTDGSFRFPAVPNGKFKVVAYYKGEHVAFDIVPAVVEFEVNQGSVVIEEPFQVAGFSVYGKVINKKGGRGIPDAKILVNGKEMGVSDAEGIYHLVGMKTGHYEISASAEQLYFDGTKVKITPNTPQLPDLIATRFNLCGRIVIDKLPEGLSYTSTQRQVTLNPKGKPTEVTTLTSDHHGAFCAEVKPGTYVLKVVLTEHELKAGLKLAPTEKEATVTDEPVSGVIFSQFRAKVHGTVNCLEKCGNLQLSLSPIGRTDDRQLTQTTDGPKGAAFTFTDVMPGKYKVSLLHEEWCWKEKTAEIEVVDKDVTDISFVQSGYILSCSLSHDIRLNFAQENKPGNVGSFSLTKGVNKFCLAQPGVYKLTLDSCHQFEQDIYRYDTANPSVLTLTAIKHRVEGAIVSADNKNDVIVNIKSSTAGEKPVDLGPLKADANKDDKTPHKFIYRFQYWARGGEKLHIKPKSGELLFYPEHIDATSSGESCPGEVARFEGKMGVFISGKIDPPLKGVKITITDDTTQKIVLNVDTNDKGSYRVGPLHSDTKYSVGAEKEGYILTASTTHQGSFKAFKLGEIIVKVLDEKNQPLPGALLSLSGGQYRSNKVTSDNGVMSFLGLGPGQYFLRPMMKEYKFEPQSQMIDVLEGATINVEVKSVRVAYSCYGKVTSLNGEAEPGIVLEAVSRSSAGCENLQEESKTEQDGSFRIRGLQPNCEYDIKLKTGDVNQHIERASPKTTLVKVTADDVTKINIIAFRRMNQLDLSGNVITAPEHLSSIKISLFRESNLDSPIHTISLSSTSFFYLPSLTIDNQNYVVRLVSNLPKSSYEHRAQELTFTANTSHHHFTFTFQPKMKSLDQELSQGSFLILPVTIIIGLIVYNYKRLLPLAYQSLEGLQNIIQKSSVGPPGMPRDVTGQPIINPDLLAAGEPPSGKKKKVRKT